MSEKKRLKDPELAQQLAKAMKAELPKKAGS